MKAFRIFLAVTLLLLFTIVVVQNTDVVALRFFAWEFSMSLIILLVLTLLAGFTLGYLTAKASGLKKKVGKTLEKATS